MSQQDVINNKILLLRMGAIKEKIQIFYYKNKIWLLLVMFALLPLLISFLFFPFVGSFEGFSLNPDTVKSYISSFGEYSVLIFFALGILAIVAPPIPNDVVTLAGIWVFGLWTGILYAEIIRIIGSSINYFIGVGIRNGFFIKLIKSDEQEKLRKYTGRLGWRTVFFSRFLIPSTDTDIVAYAAGIAKLGYWKFITATFLGMQIVIFLFYLPLGYAIGYSKYIMYLVIISYVLSIVFAPYILKKVFHK